MSKIEETRYQIVSTWEHDAEFEVEIQPRFNLSSEGVDGRRIILREYIDMGKLGYMFLERPDDYDLGKAFVDGKKQDKEGQLTLVRNYLGRDLKSGYCHILYRG